MNHDLILNPSAQLVWAPAASPKAQALVDAISIPATLFGMNVEALATPKKSVFFWRQLVDMYLAGLCKLPEQAPASVPNLPAMEVIEKFIQAAPKNLPGREVLSVPVVYQVWFALGAWVQGEIQTRGSRAAFLDHYAPEWKIVGKLTFHLVENRADEAKPFAFAITYSDSLGMYGKAVPLTLADALSAHPGRRQAILAPLARLDEAGVRWLHESWLSQKMQGTLFLTPEQAYGLLTSTDAIEAQGIELRIPNWWKKRSRPRVQVTLGEKRLTKIGTAALLDFHVEGTLGDEPLTAQELEALLAKTTGPLVFFRGSWVEVADKTRLAEALTHWKKVAKQHKNGQITFIEGMRLLAGVAEGGPAELDQDNTEGPGWFFVTAGPALLGLMERLRHPDRLAAIEPGRGLKTELRPYQKEGVAWLHFLLEMGLGACLADDMGLGKTIQVLALLLILKDQAEQGREAAGGGPDARRAPPSLLVAPASLLANWKSEIEKFTPSLRVLYAHASETPAATLALIAEDPERQLAAYDLVVTTYSMLPRHAWMRDVSWHLGILDEAQAIKNSGTDQARLVKTLQTQARLVLTGTPVENRLGDLWSLFDYINPGLLGTAEQFKAIVNRPHVLRRLVQPYILRRLKTDKTVIADLPDKIETQQICSLTPLQARLYKRIVKDLDTAIGSAAGIARSGIVLQSLMRLKQVCNHPDQLQSGATGVYRVKDSGKFQRLVELVEDIAQRGERVLVFTQFAQIVPALVDTLATVWGRPGLSIHGGTPVALRKKLVAAFQDPAGPPYMVLSLKAGGVGLNLTAAANVIHFDRWWNPAVEDQATDRAYRIGQLSNVQVHKFLTKGTVEERIDALIQEKRQLSAEIIGDGTTAFDFTKMSNEDILSLVQLDISRAEFAEDDPEQA